MYKVFGKPKTFTTGADEDIPEVLCSREGKHGGEGHVFLSILVRVDQALVSVVDHL